MSRSTRQKDISDLSAVANTTEGRRLLKRIINTSGMLTPPLVPDAPESSHYNMGVASMGQWLWGELVEAAPEALGWYITECAKELQQQPEEAQDDE